VALLGAWRYDRKLFWCFCRFTWACCFRPVYGRYHYVADVIAGIAVGFFGFLGGAPDDALQGALPGEPRRRRLNRDADGANCHSCTLRNRKRCATVCSRRTRAP